jgi:adenine-specific DNA-methyltransferase
MRTHNILETLVTTVARQIDKLIQADKKFIEWSVFHGWNEEADSKIVAWQAALNLVLRAVICRRLLPGILLDAASPNLIVERSNELLRDIGLVSPPPSYLDSLATQVTTMIDMVAIDHLIESLSNEQADLIGEFYATSVPQNARRPLGQFWTPLPIAELMTGWAIQSPSDRVLDPAFGTGVFLLTAMRRLRQLGAAPDANFAQIASVELSPLVWLMGLTNVLLRYPTARPYLKWADFLMPEREPLAVLKEPVAPDYSRQHLTSVPQQLILPGMEVQVPLAFSGHFDSILCNPPYTRHHHLPESYKSTWASWMKQEYGIQLSRFSSLFAYFLVQATRILAPTGRMAFITPAVVFEASYSGQIKAFIRQQLHLRAIITFDESLPVFEGVDTAACITLIEGRHVEQSTANQVMHIQLNKWPGVETILGTIEQGNILSDKWGTSQKFALTDLDPQRKWTVLGRRNDRINHDAFIPLSEVARIVRGIATGANNFFVLSDEEVQQWGLNRAYLRPVLTKTREAPGYIFNQEDFDRLEKEGKKRWLLYLNSPIIPGSPEERYVRYGETLGLHQRSLVKTRSLWYTMEQRDPAPIYFTYLSRRKSRFIYNQADVLALNVFLCIYPKASISQDETALKALLAILNSLVAKDSLRHVGRTYGGDTIKIEPREMDQLPILNPAWLSPCDQERLARLFELLCQADSETTEKTLRQTIDEAIGLIC